MAILKLHDDQAHGLRLIADGTSAADVIHTPWFKKVGLLGWRGQRLRITHAGHVALALSEGRMPPITDAQRLALERAREATDDNMPFYAPSETTGTRELSLKLRRELEELGFLARRDGAPNGSGCAGFIYFEITASGRAVLDADTLAVADREHPVAEPQWAIGHHEWRDNGAHCTICQTSREHDDGDGWLPTLTPCVPRLVAQVAGFYTTDEAARELGISRSVFNNRLRTSNLVPAAVSANNVYYWRREQLTPVAASPREDRDGYVDISECVHCNFLTLNAPGDECACGSELYPVRRNAPPGTRIDGSIVLMPARKRGA